MSCSRRFWRHWSRPPSPRPSPHWGEGDKHGTCFGIRMNTLADPRQAQTFRFVRCGYADGVAELVYAFDEGPELVERVRFPDAPALPPERQEAFAAALRLLHLIAGVSYYKAGVPARIGIESAALDEGTATFMDELYLHGLAEFAYRNGLDLRGRIVFPFVGTGDSGLGTRDNEQEPPSLSSQDSNQLPRRTLVPIGGGKDSLVVVEALKASGAEATAAWVG